MPRVDKPARLIIRLLFGFASDLTNSNNLKILRLQCCLSGSRELLPGFDWCAVQARYLLPQCRALLQGEPIINLDYTGKIKRKDNGSLEWKVTERTSSMCWTRKVWNLHHTGVWSSGGIQFFRASASARNSASRASRSVATASEGVRRT